MPTLTPNAGELFSRDMKRYQKLLNRRLLDQLDNEFTEWLDGNRRVDRRKNRHLTGSARRRRNEEMRRLKDRRTDDGQREAVSFLRKEIADNLAVLYRLTEYQETLRRSLAATDDETTRRDILLDHAEILGASSKQIGEDRKAFARWLDEGAIFDRYDRQRGELQQRLAFHVNRLGEVLEQIAVIHGTAGMEGVWRRLQIDELMLDLVEFPGDSRVDVEAVRCYRKCLVHLSEEAAARFLGGRTKAKFYSLATESHHDVWLQNEAISCLMWLDRESFLSIIRMRLAKFARVDEQHQETGQHDNLDRDDIFVRRHIVRELIAGSENREFWPVLKNVARDESVFVRQQLATGLWKLPAELATAMLEHFMLYESHPQVIAATLASAVENAGPAGMFAEWLRRWPACMKKHNDTFVLRAGLYAVTQWLTANGSLADYPQVVATYQSTILPTIRLLETSHPETKVRRWAAHAYQSLVCRIEPATRELLAELSEFSADLQPGQIRRLPKKLASRVAPESIARLLTVLAQDDYGFDLHYGWSGCWVARQPIFGNRLWRILHELCNPATDKRQAFSHTIGRVTRSLIRVPSQIMGELSRTNVPGEPFLIPSEGSWRPWLPLTDDFVSLLNLSILRPRTMKFFTSQGQTQVSAPHSWWQRLRAWLVLTWNFEKFANARDWQDGDDAPPATYVDQFRELGFEVEFLAYPDGPISNQNEIACGAEQPANDEQATDESVAKYFGCFGMMPAMGIPSLEHIEELIQRYSTYFYSIYDNTLQQLLVFVVLFALFFAGRHVYANWRLRKARNRIPLVVGGWGTRGKSGTERLKAALVNALGFGMVSKTTGCEAMFIHNDAFGEPLEIPLYRPYDKATIWEQSDVIQMAQRMDASVFLWECMGLNPTYVDILQRQWTRDDLSTVTNTYPDHEDIQGPAGYNVACTIAGFVPEDGKVITTEQEMRPIVRNRCRNVGTELRGVGWLESGLIPDEILDRFPYREHPDNIALVAAMADELNVEYDYALKAMADEMVPDLGVLKTYPVSNIRGRHIEFTNGMSANERFGCLGNWTRLGFDQHDPHADPQTWVSTVINNRADRVARSRVFSSIIVNDVEADCHFLIGTNLQGLVGFIEDDLALATATLSLADNEIYSSEAGLTALKKLARQYRLPTKPEHIVDCIEVMLAELGVPAGQVGSRWNQPEQLLSLLKQFGVGEEWLTAVQTQQSRLVTSYNEFVNLSSKIVAAENNDATWLQLDAEYQELARTWFRRKLFVVDDSGATGEQILDRIVRATPPGVRNRVMGMQNIKGTGLDLIYRFQDWQICYDACQSLSHSDPGVVQKGLSALQDLPVLGQLCDSIVRTTVGMAASRPDRNSEIIKQSLKEILAKADTSRSSIEQLCSAAETKSKNGSSSWSGLVKTLAGWLEEVLDVNDAIRRRTKSDQIYTDLAHQRISRQRAVMELRKINKRQKGGWLSASLKMK